MKTALLMIGAITLLVGPAVHTQTKSPPKLSTTAFDTPAQREAKLYSLSAWCLDNSSKEHPAASRPEYALKVLEILKRWPPHRITYDMYKDLTTDDEFGNYLANGWLTFGALPTELSRTAIGDTEVVIYQWKNPDGSNVVGTYRNGHLVSKAQSGLR